MDYDEITLGLPPLDEDDEDLDDNGANGIALSSRNCRLGGER